MRDALKAFELTVDDFERVDRIIGVGIARVDQMDEEAGAFDVSEEKRIAETRAFVCAFDEAREDRRRQKVRPSSVPCPPVPPSGVGRPLDSVPAWLKG